MNAAMGKVASLVQRVGYRKALSLLSNKSVNRIEQRLNRTRLFSHPYYFHVELANRCDTNCQLCPVGLGYAAKLRNQYQTMTAGTFAKVLALASNYAMSIDFGIWGEPTVNELLPGFIAECRRSNIPSELKTNGHKLSKHRELFHDLVAAGLNSLCLSLHGMSEKSYQAYQPGKSFFSIMDFLDFCAEYSHRKPLNVTLSFAITSQNEHEVESFRSYCAEKGFVPMAYPASMNVRFLPSNDARIDSIAKWRSLRFRHEEMPLLHHYYNTIENKSAYHGKKCISGCSEPYNAMTVLCDGSVLSCCGIYPCAGETFSSIGAVWGNVNDLDIAELRNNKFFQSARRIVSESNEPDGADIVACRGCINYIS